MDFHFQRKSNPVLLDESNEIQWGRLIGYIFMKQLYHLNFPSLSNIIIIYFVLILFWTDARRPVPRLWIRSDEVRGGGGGR